MKVIGTNDPTPFSLLLEGLPGADPARVKAKWTEEKTYPRLFEIIESDHPGVWPGDRVYIVASGKQTE